MLTVDGGGSERLSGVLGNSVFRLQLKVKKKSHSDENVLVSF